MDELFEEYLEIVNVFFVQCLLYWCDVFLCLVDQVFNVYLNVCGQVFIYLVFEGFDLVYIFCGCDFDVVCVIVRVRV